MFTRNRNIVVTKQSHHLTKPPANNNSSMTNCWPKSFAIMFSHHVFHSELDIAKGRGRQAFAESTATPSTRPRKGQHVKRQIVKQRR